MRLHDVHNHPWFPAVLILLLCLFLLFTSGLGCSASIDVGPSAKSARR